jgi:TRAP-type uncharacterized transport system substrate-binding protein
MFVLSMYFSVKWTEEAFNGETEPSLDRYVKGVAYLDFIQKKTGAPVSLPLHPSVMKVIKECGAEFPRPISNDKYNCKYP